MNSSQSREWRSDGVESAGVEREAGPAGRVHSPLSTLHSVTAPSPVIIEDPTSPGDIAVLTAAVQALHRRYPGRYRTELRTSCPALWAHNPLAVTLSAEERERAVAIRARTEHPGATYATLQRSNQRPIHVLEAYCEGLALALGLPSLAPDNWLEPSIRLSDEEQSWVSQVHEQKGRPSRYWLINSGVKQDYTAKAWAGYQTVVDLTRHKVNWVQVGAVEHVHEPLSGVALDLLGRTDLRQLVRLVHHAEGVLCGVTALQHLAHWVEPAGWANVTNRRHAVIVAGGRESPHWFAYPGQQIFHTIGELDCCAHGGCWKARLHPLREFPEHNTSLCAYPREWQALCMEKISPRAVADTVLRLAN